MYSDIVRQALEDMMDMASEVQEDEAIDPDTRGGIIRVTDEVITALEDLRDVTKGI